MMNEVHTTIVIVLAGIAALMFVMPLLSAVPWLKERISFSWCIVAVSMCMGLGCIIDLNHLSDEIKTTVIGGSFILAGLYMAFKFITNFVRQGGFTTHIQKGDLKVRVNTIKQDQNEYGHDNEDISRSFDLPIINNVDVEEHNHERNHRKR